MAGRLVTQCEAYGTNHSEDLIEVWTGQSRPRLVCGFHAMKLGYL